MSVILNKLISFFIWVLKMEPLTIENFDVSDSFISEPYLSTYGLTLAKFISLETSKSLPPIRIDGEFKVFINKNGKNKSFSLAISVDKTNEHFFKRLEHSLSQLASEALPLTKPEDFKLIKESKNHHNVYCKIYTYPSGTPKCLYSELVSGKCRVKPLEDAAFEKFNPMSCRVYFSSNCTGGLSPPIENQLPL